MQPRNQKMVTGTLSQPSTIGAPKGLLTAVMEKPPATATDAATTWSSSFQRAASRIASIHYSLDSATEWTTVLPDSGLCDSESEVFTLEIKDAKPGTHRVTVKAADAFGNTGYGTVTATVAK